MKLRRTFVRINDIVFTLALLAFIIGTATTVLMYLAFVFGAIDLDAMVFYFRRTLTAAVLGIVFGLGSNALDDVLNPSAKVN